MVLTFDDFWSFFHRDCPLEAGLPQVVLNFRRKSVNGLSLDYQFLGQTLRPSLYTGIQHVHE